MAEGTKRSTSQYLCSGPPSALSPSPLISTDSAQYCLDDEWPGIVLDFFIGFEDICNEIVALLETKYQRMKAAHLYDLSVLVRSGI